PGRGGERGAPRRGRGTRRGQDLGHEALLDRGERERDVLDPDLRVVPGDRLAHGELEDLLGGRGDRDVPAGPRTRRAVPTGRFGRPGTRRGNGRDGPPRP